MANLYENIEKLCKQRGVNVTIGRKPWVFDRFEEREKANLEI